jgi:uncharacterized protein (DUF3820 family)
MSYEVFPFGKYKGVKLNDLPSSYIAYAIEKFELPKDLRNEIGRILLGRLNVYSYFLDVHVRCTKKMYVDFLKERMAKFEKGGENG